MPWSDAVDLPSLRASLILNLVEVDSGLGSAVMGDPAAAVAWLARALSSFDAGIEAGQFVMSGSFTTAVPITSGDCVTASMDGLGTVSVRMR
ncbi:MAG TPA: hypothetical protein VF477_09305 [Mycobacterium sp.]